MSTFGYKAAYFVVYQGGRSGPALWILTSAAGNVILSTSGQCARYGRGVT